ncbi:uncharacterized protein [Lolium perenne]|uniref:uncharacterized protein n=1 Tax=Lolium perenne TaxID=4522 RepID=UPI0021F553E6|nr:uncharacterized protein LOC127328541 [Lolium perenne]
MASTTAHKMAPRAGELGEDLEMACDESRRISTEIENLKSQLEKKVKELGYCEEKKKLRVELALKPKEMERLRKQNDELQAKNKGLQNNILEMLENQIVAKKRHLLQLERLEIQLELQNMMELPNDWLQKGNMKLNKEGKEACGISNAAAAVPCPSNPTLSLLPSASPRSGVRRSSYGRAEPTRTPVHLLQVQPPRTRSLSHLAVCVEKNGEKTGQPEWGHSGRNPDFIPLWLCIHAALSS